MMYAHRVQRSLAPPHLRAVLLLARPMAAQESDDCLNIVEGDFVYWMDLDASVRRGALGIVGISWECGAGYRKVHFVDWEGEVPEDSLNKCNFQKGTFVHLSGEEWHSAVGQVIEWDWGQLVVEINGRQVKSKPNQLIRCDFQQHSLVHVLSKPESSDNAYLIGEGIYSVGDRLREGKLMVNHFFDQSDLALTSIQMGEYVVCPDGRTGWCRGRNQKDRRLLDVQFAGFGEETFSPSQLKRSPLQVDSFVKWTYHDDDVPKGAVGTVKSLRMKDGKMKVRFPEGTWNFKVSQLRPLNIQPGHYVLWKKHDDDIPQGDIGEVVRLAGSGKLDVQWPGGNWCFWPSSLRLLPFQRRDRVFWGSADDDIPDRSIGRVRGIKYANGNGRKLLVNFPKGSWGFPPSDLQSADWTTAKIHRLKATFARFDQNGDGAISATELTDVLISLGLAEQQCQEMFRDLDQDADGMLSVEEFVDYVFGEGSAVSRLDMTESFKEEIGAIPTYSTENSCK